MLASSQAFIAALFGALTASSQSASHKRNLAGAYLPLERISVVPHGVPDPGVATGPGQALLFVVASRLGSGLPAQCPLIIAGSGKFEEKVRAIARGLPNTRFAGQLSAREVRVEIARATAVIVPSVVPESFGLGAVEAFASGRPVVASRIGGPADLVDEGVGWTVAPDSSAELADVLEDIDPVEAARRGGLHGNGISLSTPLILRPSAYSRCSVRSRLRSCHRADLISGRSRARTERSSPAVPWPGRFPSSVIVASRWSRSRDESPSLPGAGARRSKAVLLSSRDRKRTSECRTSCTLAPRSRRR